jgi:aminopeptidase-like protein
MPDGLGSEALAALGEELHAWMASVYPICRSITGEGTRATLRALRQLAPVELFEVPSGSPALDWTVPPEWNVREAWIAGPDGRRVVDLADHALHLVSYSVPVRQRMPLSALRPHLHALPDQPDRIPYRTSYYAPTWGFCLTQRRLDALVEGEYEVCIDSTLEGGSLTFAELLLPGDSADEVLLSAHCCHPQLADDNLSGMAVAAALARHFADRPRRLSLRFLFAPGTIGALAWLERNRAAARRIRYGLTLTCLGDGHPFTFKKTADGGEALDLLVPAALAAGGHAHQTIDFFPYGYDERQFNSPGFRLPVGSLMRGRHGQFAEYHTSGDDLSFVRPAHLAESFAALVRIVEAVQENRRYRSLVPEGEPQLGKRGLYRAMGGLDIPDLQLALLWVLNQADGRHGLSDVALRSGLPLATLEKAAALLLEQQLLEAVS